MKFKGFNFNTAPIAMPLKAAARAGTNPKKKLNRIAKRALEAFIKKIAINSSRTFLFFNVFKCSQMSAITFCPNDGTEIAKIIPETKITMAVKIYHLTS